jgi:hypothetical protein
MRCLALVIFTSPVQAFVRHQRCVSRISALVGLIYCLLNYYWVPVTDLPGYGYFDGEIPK